MSGSQTKDESIPGTSLAARSLRERLDRAKAGIDAPSTPTSAVSDVELRRTARLRAGQPLPFELLSLDDLRLLPERQSLVDGLLDQRTLALLYGAPGIGKSLLTLDLLFSIACGVEWAGRGVAKGPVLYIAAEGIAGFNARRLAWESYRGLLIPAENFRVIAGAPRLTDPDEINRLKQAIQDWGVQPIALAIDTFSATAPGIDENTAGSVSTYMAAAQDLVRSTGATVLIVHHKGQKSRAPRGSTVFTANVDTVIELGRLGGSSNRLQATLVKQRDGAGGPVAGLCRELVKIGNGSLSAVIVPDSPGTGMATSATPDQGMRPKEQLALEVLRRITAHSSVSQVGVTTTEWLDAALDRTPISVPSFYRLKGSLIERNLVEVLDPPLGSKRRGHRYLPMHGDGKE